MVKESSDDGNMTNRYEQTDFGLFVFASSDTGATEPVRFTPGLADIASVYTQAVIPGNVAIPGAPTITTQPADQTVTAGQTATFTVAATGDEPLSYQWKKDGNDLSDGGRISGAATATLTISNAQASDAGSYTVVVSNSTGSVTSNAATLTVNTLSVIDIAAIPGVTPPARGAAPVNAITETAQYTGTVSWSPDDNPFKGGTVYTATITLTPKAGYTLTGVAENFFIVAGATSVSNAADSGVVTAVFPATKYAVIYDANGGTGTAPTEGDKAAGETFIAADNTFDPPAGTYKKFKHWNLKADGTGSNYLPGETVYMPSNDLTLYAIWVLPELSGSVSIVGEAKYGSTLSALPLLDYNPDTNEDEPSYQWKRDGVDIEGAINSTYTLTEADIGYQISVTVTADSVHAIGSITSEPTAAVDKADGPEAPAAPTLASKTHNSVTLVANEAYEFKVDGGDWQDSNVFTGLLPGTEYTFKARVKETATHKASAESEGLTVTTNILVESITVRGAADATSVAKSGTLQMIADISPPNATDNTVTWSVSPGTGTASIDAESGLLTGTGEGTVTVRATANDGSGVYGGRSSP